MEAVLHAGQAAQVISVRTFGAGAADAPVPGAAVSITTPNGTQMAAFESGRSPGVYFVDLTSYGHAIFPGATYRLRVVTRSGDIVEGTTTVPQAFPVNESGGITPFSRSRDTLRASWDRVADARSYYVTVTAHLSYAPGYFDLRYSTFADTAIALRGTLEHFDGDRVFTPDDTVTVVAGAVDDNFYTYYHANVDPFAGTPPSRLSGALGVFGSFVPLYHRRFAVIE